MDIRNQTGTVERPIATLGDVLPDLTKNDLKKMTEVITAQAGFQKRTQWWIDKHPMKTVLSAATLGAIVAVSLAAYLKRD